ncbi:hypothetical protein CONLIGDRAFT_275548 [Coniochaeta ligniaria NRRL 30616]|uniref:BZIP domain-containing protein n=1 Tax=Coniochaeta ligniaria NRRL 30616 TaxID=1408157 RepID=A0A1J7JXW0_9PEZI|nr:hypothetical protein CONLIGDRAFT_275548 [Coniochaeta ligniaria NRRL 30616]
MLSETSDVTERNGRAANEKRKPVRRDPEKRRQQNVQAQRKYREKLRERLDKLEGLAASLVQSRAAAATTAAATRTSQKVPSPDSSITTPAALTPSHEVTASYSSSTPAQPIVRSCLNAPPTPAFISVPWGPQQTTPVSDDASSVSELSIWGSHAYIDPSFLVRDKGRDNIGTYCTTTFDCGCPTPHSHVVSRGPEASSRGEFKVLTFRPGSTGADPYANALRLETMCTMAAISALGTYIGISQEYLCAEESLSPFFRPGAASTDKADTVSTVQKIFKTLKPDLRPSREQITVAHHPFIDILPFPTLRNNLIAQQVMLDEDEFCEDILAGLVCWGGAGVGQRDREASTGFASTGMPWDVRSWEARAWFVKKYWTLLGGEDGELVRQSEWWRGVRGEDSLEVAVCC